MLKIETSFEYFNYYYYRFFLFDNNLESGMQTWTLNAVDADVMFNVHVYLRPRPPKIDRPLPEKKKLYQT